jgi:hypothetical protein
LGTEWALNVLVPGVIAGEPVIAPRIVEWALGHAYAKLGVRTRRELRTALG